MLGIRIVSGMVGVPLLVGLVLLGGVWYLLGVLVPAVLGTLEIFSMLNAAGHRPVAPLGLIVAASFVLDAAFPGYRVLPTTLAVSGVAALAWLMVRSDWSKAVVDWALTFAPALYVGGLLQFFIPLRESVDGVFWALTVLICAWSCDTAAYFVGGAIGRTKLAPRISPAKSVEGAVAGVVGAVIVAVAAALIASQPLLRSSGLGLAVGLCAVLGDLIESFLKRACGAKDSGVLVPGHGGILDRMDSLLVAAAGGYLYLAATA